MNGQNNSRKGDIILVPLDDSPESQAALPIASTMGGLTDATLHILHVSPHRMTLDELRRRLSLSPEQLAGCVLDQLEGEAADGIMRTAVERKALLIVMTMRRCDHCPETGVGSVAEIIVRRAPCPVLLVPPSTTPPPWHLRQMLLPQNGTPATVKVVESVCHLAHHAGASLFVLHVSDETIIPPLEPGTLHIPHYMDQPQHEWPIWTGEFLGRIRGMCHLPQDVELRMFLARGEAASEIVRLAQKHQVDMIAMPWHGDIADAPILKAVLRAAPCPVLILPFEIPPQRRHARAHPSTEVHPQ